MRKEWMFMVWFAVLLCGTASGVLGQETAEPDRSPVVGQDGQGEGEQEPAEGAQDGPPHDGGTVEGGEAGARSPTEQSVFSDIWRVLRQQQRHLTGTKEDASLPLGGILALFLVAYVIIVFGVLTFWRRSHTPTFRQQRLEQIQGAGRWTCAIAYAIRRKVDARIELRMTKVEPEGTAAELACLVDGQIKGRISPDAAAYLDFPGLNPKSFWQKDQQEVIPLGFELIQPREHAITLHIEGRVEYSVGGRHGKGGEFRQVLEFKPAVVDGLTGLVSSNLSKPPLQALGEEPVPFADPQVLPLAAPVSAPGLTSSTQLADRAAEASSLAAERALSSLDEFQRRRQEIDQRLKVLEAKEQGASEDREGRGRGREIKALEERLGSDLRENIQAVMEQVDDLRSEVSSLRALVSDLAQRVP